MATKSKKGAKASSQSPESTSSKPLPEVKKVRTFDVKLTTEELVHLRDLFSVMLPPDGSRTLSQSLALVEKRQMIEAKLWDKLMKLCAEAEVPVGDEAPDYAVAMAGLPHLGVFPINVPSVDEEDTEG